MSCSSISSSSFPSPAWADLPNDILELVVRSMHSPFDRLRFGAVCRSWREVFAAVKQNPAGRCGVAPLPILTFRDPADGAVQVPEEGATPVTRCFYSLSEDKVYRLQVPSESHEWRCFGCSRGWLGMIDLSTKPFLFDPISGARVDLPSLTTLTRLILLVKTRKRDGETVYIYKEPNDTVRRGFPITGIELRDMFIDRLALSSSPLDPNCIVMTTVSGYRLPAYTRPGDDAWVQVPDLRSDCWYFGDIIYHDEGVFYAVAGEDETFAITFGPPNSPPSVEVLVPTVSFTEGSRGYYLVVLPSGDLLLVTRFRDQDLVAGKTDLFQLHKLTVDKQLGAAWVEVEDIGDCCLFLGTAHSMSLPASQILGKYRANCIFFTEDRTTYTGGDWEGLDHGIYEIGEGTVEHFCHIDARRVFPQPMWITPRPDDGIGSKDGQGTQELLDVPATNRIIAQNSLFFSLVIRDAAAAADPRSTHHHHPKKCRFKGCSKIRFGGDLKNALEAGIGP